MNIIVIGCGKIGSTILASLSAEGHDVVAVDINPELIAEITNVHDVMGVCGNGADYDTLKEAGAEEAQLVVAATGSDELNLLSCYLAKKMGTENTIARVRNPEYSDKTLNFMRKHMEISMTINPERLAAHELYNILKLPSAVKIENFAGRFFEMIEIRLKPDSKLDGMRITEMRTQFNAKFLICAVKRGDTAYIPDGNFILRSGDRIGITAAPTEILKLLKELGILQKQARNIMILGGSRTSYFLARRLTNAGSSVTIIERDRQLCEELCEALPKAVIINADGAQQEILLEEGLHSLDAFVSLTGIDEENILISSFAQSQNVPTVIAKVNRDELIPLSEHWGLDCIVSPKRLISDVLVKYARALQNSAESSVESLFKLMDDKVEALEFTVKADSKMKNIAFRDLKTKPNTLIAGILRDRKPIIPSGEDMLLPGDKVVVFAANQRINSLSDILK